MLLRLPAASKLQRPSTRDLCQFSNYTFSNLLLVHARNCFGISSLIPSTRCCARNIVSIPRQIVSCKMTLNPEVSITRSSQRVSCAMATRSTIACRVVARGAEMARCGDASRRIHFRRSMSNVLDDTDDCITILRANAVDL